MFCFFFQCVRQMCSSSNGMDLLHTIDQQSLKWFHSYNPKKEKRKKSPPPQTLVSHLLPKSLPVSEMLTKAAAAAAGRGGGGRVHLYSFSLSTICLWQLNWFLQAQFFYLIQPSVQSTTPACQAPAPMGAAGTCAQISVLTRLGKLSETAQKDRGL